MTLVILGVLGFAVFSLGQAMFAMASGPDHSGKVVWALTRRIAVSVLLFAFLMIGWKLGWIEPNAVR